VRQDWLGRYTPTVSPEAVRGLKTLVVITSAAFCLAAVGMGSSNGIAIMMVSIDHWYVYVQDTYTVSY
jgi:hypothetical protein